MHQTQERSRIFRAVVLALSTACAVSAEAADGSGEGADQATQGNAQATTSLESIVVSGEGHKEQLQKASTPITAFSATKILDAGIQTTGDFVRLVPNMSYDTSFTIGNSLVVMRGIQQVNNADAPIAIVVDGVPQNNQKEFKMDLFDVERIEVLRGPQGALYGRNAIGGAINITTKQPTDSYEGFFQAGVGDDGLYKIAASSSGPIVKDELFYRVAVSGTSFDGSIRNSYTGQDVDYYKGHDIRAQLKWRPTDSQELDLRLNNSLLWGGAVYDTSFPGGMPNDTNIWQAPLSDIPGDSHRRINAATLRYKLDLGGMVFSSITAYTNIFENYYGDLDFCNPVVCPQGLGGLGQVDQQQALKVRDLSQELRLSSSDDATIKWTGGVYAIDTHRDLGTLAHALQLPGAPAIVNSDESNHNFAWAVFGQIQAPIGDSNQIGLSLRYDDDNREQTNMAIAARRDANFGSWQPKLTFTRFLGDAQQIYVTSGNGFRSGGFNGIGGAEFLPETLTNYEIGYKTSWLDNRLVVNSAIFYERDRNYQFFYVDLKAGGAQVIANLKEVAIKGLETEVNWLVRPGWQLFGSLGLLGSRIEEVGDISTSLPIVPGKRAPRTEPYSFVFGAQWNFGLGERSGMFRFDVSRKGPRTWEPDNADIMDPVTLVNARFTYFGGERWNVTGWVTNLFNHHYYNDFVPNTFLGSGRDIASPAQGRHFGVDYRYEF